jgi:hydrogenase-1 operon protein HyaF
VKAGFWIAPEGGEEAIMMLPVGAEDDLARRRNANLLATRSAEELIERCPEVARLLPQIAEALASQRAAEPSLLFDITDFAEDDRELITQVLGEGEVSGVAGLTDGVLAQIQESVMAGLWRVRFTDANNAQIGDYLEIGSIPRVVRKSAELTRPDLTFGEPPEGAMNVMPLLAEIEARLTAHRPGEPACVINFSLLPMNEIDMQFLQKTLGDGPVRLVSRGYGACRVHATGARNVWSVQFFNAMDTIILDTLEIGDTPLSACAADEDFQDSAERLREIYEAYFR